MLRCCHVHRPSGNPIEEEATHQEPQQRLAAEQQATQAEQRAAEAEALLAQYRARFGNIG